MRCLNRKRKPKHMTKMKWGKVDKHFYSKSRCTKSISSDMVYSSINKDKQLRYETFNFNDWKRWKGF